MGVPRVGYRGASWLEGFFCGKKKKKNMEFHTAVHFLDGLEGKE